MATAKFFKKSTALARQMSQWFQENRRPLPWRSDRDPYAIWISEVMLQQTTVTAVVPFFKNFLAKFPDVDTLARSPLEKVLKAWAGLGYYSRARRLKEAAEILSNLKTFPKTYKELLQLPGFGPYTARAVSSLAFGEAVGVVDGNVVRVLTRQTGFEGMWWRASSLRELQSMADALAQSEDPYLINQALMELGATVCTPQKPSCGICPWSLDCVALKNKSTARIPLSKPRPPKEIWIWKPRVLKRKNKVGIVINDYAPFLKDQWFLPGTAKSVSKAPQKFAYKHFITKYEIYVQLDERQAGGAKDKTLHWVPIQNISHQIPSSLIRKALQHHKNIEAED